MQALAPRQVVLHGADESLRALLSDVLEDMGLSLRSSGAETGAETGARPDVVLALVQREESVPRVLRVAGDEAGAAPVVALLPFEDERLRRLAMSLGARDCYALGTPLEVLKRLLRNLMGERS
jgi:DNA-binding NarL/FixJ family response regulator